MMLNMTVFHPDIVRLLTPDVIIEDIQDSISNSLCAEYEAIWDQIKARNIKLKPLNAAIETLQKALDSAEGMDLEDLKTLESGAKSLLKRFVETKDTATIKALDSVVSNYSDQHTERFKECLWASLPNARTKELRSLLDRKRAFKRLVLIEDRIKPLTITENALSGAVEVHSGAVELDNPGAVDPEPRAKHKLKEMHPDDINSILDEVNGILARCESELGVENGENPEFTHNEKRTIARVVDSPAEVISLYEGPVSESAALSAALRDGISTRSAGH